MQLVTFRNFHEHAAQLFRKKEPIVITHKRLRGHGVFFPPGTLEGLPKEMRLKIYDVLSAKVAQELKNHGIVEEEVLEHFENWRKKHRTTRHRR